MGQKIGLTPMPETQFATLLQKHYSDIVQWNKEMALLDNSNVLYGNASI